MLVRVLDFIVPRKSTRNRSSFERTRLRGPATCKLDVGYYFFFFISLSSFLYLFRGEKSWYLMMIMVKIEDLSYILRNC